MTLLFSSGCPGEPFYGLFGSVLCICTLSPLPLRLQTFHPGVQLLNSEGLPHFSVISLFAVKHCSSSFFFFYCKYFTVTAAPLLNPYYLLTVARQGFSPCQIKPIKIMSKHHQPYRLTIQLSSPRRDHTLGARSGGVSGPETFKGFYRG